MVRGYPGEGGEDEKGPGAFASKDPSLAPSSQHLLFPPCLLKRKDPGLHIQTTTGPARRVSGAGWERLQERETRSGRVFGADHGLAAQASLRWGGDSGEGSSLEGPTPPPSNGRLHRPP